MTRWQYGTGPAAGPYAEAKRTTSCQRKGDLRLRAASPSLRPAAARTRQAAGLRVGRWSNRLTFWKKAIAAEADLTNEKERFSR